MGKLRKRHNWKARQQKTVSVEVLPSVQIGDEALASVSKQNFDENNTFVLPSRKRKTKVSDKPLAEVKPLSKKRRKLLQKVLVKKQKKLKRAELLESLQQVQLSHEKLLQFTSVTDMQSGRMNRKCKEEKINSVVGARRKQASTDAHNKLLSSSSSSGDDDSMESDDDDDDDDESQVLETEATLQSSATGKAEELNMIKKVKDKAVDVVANQSSSHHVDRPPAQPAVHVDVKRSPEVEKERLRLPVVMEEQSIMETIHDNPVVIVSGETGSGKTTQVPQFLYEAGYTRAGHMIGITEPRRVAATCMSHRVAEEMSLSYSRVSYQIRYEGNVTKDTEIKFMTDGVLLKEIQKDFLLSRYSAIILDEVHERSAYTDILIGLLSRIVPMRHKRDDPLKLILMSATLRLDDFVDNRKLFKVSPPVLKVDARQFPVTVHFNKRTHGDYLTEAYRKVGKIHCQLPDGGILVFVTGQQEVHTLCSKLRRSFPTRPCKDSTAESSNVTDKDSGKVREQRHKPLLPTINLDDYPVLPMNDDEEEQVDSDVPRSDNDTDSEDGDTSELKVSSDQPSKQPIYVLPLYSLLSPDKQAKVFQPPPEGARLCVVATNVAETSLTIPGIKYVVDTGKVKTKFYDKVTGVSTFRVTWTSKASANQRAGRAGRTSPGHCYRLYSSAVFNNDFEDFTPPEISRRPVDDLVLQMKDMNIDRVINFPFPTPPDVEALQAAERLLLALGAVKQLSVKLTSGRTDVSVKITELGQSMAKFPLAPRYAKMLCLGHQHNLLPYVVAMVSALSVQEVFVESWSTVPGEDEAQKEEQKRRQCRLSQIQKIWAGSGNSLLLGDLMVLLKAVGAAEYAGCTVQFCESRMIRVKAMQEIRKLRRQLTNAVNVTFPEANLILDPKMEPPSNLQAELLRQIVLAGMGNNIARKVVEPLGLSPEEAKKIRHSYQSMILDEPVFIHPSSVLYKSNAEFVVYQTIEETSKLYMKGVTAVESYWLPIFVPFYCNFAKPSDDPPPRYNADTDTVVCHMSSTFGPHFWSLAAVELEFPDNLDKIKWFAKFFLSGDVFSALKQFASVLLSTPSTMVKTWARLQPRTETILLALAQEKITTKQQLLSVWERDQLFLLDAYLSWLPESLHNTVRKKWPPT